MIRIAWRDVLPWLLVAVGVLLYGCERERTGELRGQVGALEQQKAALERRAPVVRQEYIRDTIVVTKRTTRYETIRDSLVRTDTLLRTDTAFVTITAAADTAIQACRAVVSSCARNLAIADSLHLIDQRIIRAYQKAQPSLLRRWSERIAWGAGGYLVGRALTK